MAQQVEMMTIRNKYIITSLDLHTVNLDDFMHSRANITGFRLIRTMGNEPLSGNMDYSELLQEINKKLPRRHKEIKHVTTAAALMFDAVNLFARALQHLDNSKHIHEFPRLDCKLNPNGTDGTSLINYMKLAKNFHGLSGNITFDGYGYRSVFTVDILQLTRDSGLEKIGDFHECNQTYIEMNITERVYMDDPAVGLENKKYIITTILQEPYVMLKKSAQKLSGNDQYEGYIIDLIHHLAEYLHFTFEIREVEDNSHGIKNEAGKWTGMIGEVVNGTADMAIADITVNAARQEAVDFTFPFMTMGISILYRKPTTKVTSLFSFMAPFSVKLWIYLIIVYLAASVVLFLVGRLSPYEWAKAHPCRQNENIEENSFTLGSSIWFLIASFMQQGSEIEPRALSTRTIAGSWYFFKLIIISSYIAKMASFLAVEKVLYPISSAHDLAKQTQIKYGCSKKGSTRTFFEDSTDDVYKKMWSFMDEHQSDVLMSNNEEGMKNVLKQNYAFFMESAAIEYYTQKNCNLTQIGGLLDNKGYGIAVSKNNFTLSSWLSGGILYLQEEGVLAILYERWWKYKRQTVKGSCPSSASTSVVIELELNNVGGVFLVLLSGLILSAVVVCLEFLWKFQKHASLKDLFKMMAKEMKFAITCGSSTKEVPRHPQKLQKSRSKLMDSIGSRLGLYKIGLGQ